MSLRWCDSPGKAARIAALSTNQWPTAMIGCPHMSTPPISKFEFDFRQDNYVSTSLLTGAGRTRSSGRRIPAGNLEGLVINRICSFLADPGAILDAGDSESPSGSRRSQLIERGCQVAEELGAHASDKVAGFKFARIRRSLRGGLGVRGDRRVAEV